MARPGCGQILQRCRNWARPLTSNLLQKFSQTAERISITEENYKSFQLQSHKGTFNTKSEVGVCPFKMRKFIKI